MIQSPFLSINQFVQHYDLLNDYVIAMSQRTLSRLFDHNEMHTGYREITA